jgi:hypothetical protein
MPDVPREGGFPLRERSARNLSIDRIDHRSLPNKPTRQAAGVRGVRSLEGEDRILVEDFCHFARYGLWAVGAFDALPQFYEDCRVKERRHASRGTASLKV